MVLRITTLALIAWGTALGCGVAAAAATPLQDAIRAFDTGDAVALVAALHDPQLSVSLDAETGRSIYAGLGEALLRASRPAEAATAYAKALEGVDDGDTDAVEVRRAYAHLIFDTNRREALRQLSIALGALEAAGVSEEDRAELGRDLRVRAILSGFPADWRHAGWIAPLNGSAAGAAAPRGGVASAAPVESAFTLVDVFYATTRKATGSKLPTAFYGGQPGQISYGKAVVSVPRDRSPGELPTPQAWAFEFRPDPARHFVLNRVERYGTRQQFLDNVTGRMSKSRLREVLVFIHGFNMSFENGAERTAQLAVDLGLDGAPILYSWPSKSSLMGYMSDAATAEDSTRIAELAQFLADVAARTGATRVNVVAHSMGNRYLIRALNTLAAGGAKQVFGEVVFAAPDVGVDEFKAVWPTIRQVARRTTVYASGRDKALALSSRINNMPRAGDAHVPLLLSGLQTIDTTAASGGLLGHDDFSGTALDDFRAVIWLSLAPEQRCVLSNDASKSLWRFAAGCPESDFRQATTLIRTTGSVATAQAKVQRALVRAAGAEAERLRRVLDLLKGIDPGRKSRGR
ncbi:alpha/beta hydrolase [Caulobacter henricii]|uniref:alpha/beta hydrolase n=1 Tax=Caulobacter henricii TaxID=69395 RepID=UPI000A027447|nr:alpha/beta hydrolase [Caulobacter henricii]